MPDICVPGSSKTVGFVIEQWPSLTSFEFVTAQACVVFSRRRPMSFYSVLLINLADCARYSSLTDSLSRGYDPITHVRRVRFLTDVGDLQRVCYCIVIVICTARPQAASCSKTSPPYHVIFLWIVWTRSLEMDCHEIHVQCCRPLLWRFPCRFPTTSPNEFWQFLPLVAETSPCHTREPLTALMTSLRIGRSSSLSTASLTLPRWNLFAMSERSAPRARQDLTQYLGWHSCRRSDESQTCRTRFCSVLLTHHVGREQSGSDQRWLLGWAFLVQWSIWQVEQKLHVHPENEERHVWRGPRMQSIVGRRCTGRFLNGTRKSGFGRTPKLELWRRRLCCGIWTGWRNGAWNGARLLEMKKGGNCNKKVRTRTWHAAGRGRVASVRWKIRKRKCWRGRSPAVLSRCQAHLLGNAHLMWMYLSSVAGCGAKVVFEPHECVTCGITLVQIQRDQVDIFSVFRNCAVPLLTLRFSTRFSNSPSAVIRSWRHLAQPGETLCDPKQNNHRVIKERRPLLTKQLSEWKLHRFQWRKDCGYFFRFHWNTTTVWIWFRRRHRHFFHTNFMFENQMEKYIGQTDCKECMICILQDEAERFQVVGLVIRGRQG